jgi:hypothetical protein
MNHGHLGTEWRRVVPDGTPLPCGSARDYRGQPFFPPSSVGGLSCSAGRATVVHSVARFGFAVLQANHRFFIAGNNHNE